MLNECYNNDKAHKLTQWNRKISFQGVTLGLQYYFVVNHTYESHKVLVISEYLETQTLFCVMELCVGSQTGFLIEGHIGAFTRISWSGNKKGFLLEANNGIQRGLICEIEKKEQGSVKDGDKKNKNIFSGGNRITLVLIRVYTRLKLPLEFVVVFVVKGSKVHVHVWRSSRCLIEDYASCISCGGSRQKGAQLIEPSSAMRAGILGCNGTSWITLENIIVVKAEREIPDHESVDLRLDYKAILWLNLISNAFCECEGNVYEVFHLSRPPELGHNLEDKVGSSGECKGMYTRLSCAGKAGVDKVDIWNREIDTYLKKLITASKKPFSHLINMILKTENHYEKNNQFETLWLVSNDYWNGDELERLLSGIIGFHCEHKVDPLGVRKVVHGQIVCDAKKKMMNLEQIVKKLL